MRGIQVFFLRFTNKGPLSFGKADADLFFPLYECGTGIIIHVVCASMLIDRNHFSVDCCDPWASCFNSR